MGDINVRKLKKIVRTLETLEENNVIAPELAYKYALLECCGWIEEKMHNILFDYLVRQTYNPVTQELLKKMSGILIMVLGTLTSKLNSQVLLGHYT